MIRKRMLSRLDIGAAARDTDGVGLATGGKR